MKRKVKPDKMTKIVNYRLVQKKRLKEVAAWIVNDSLGAITANGSKSRLNNCVMTFSANISVHLCTVWV